MLPSTAWGQSVPLFQRHERGDRAGAHGMSLSCQHPTARANPGTNRGSSAVLLLLSGYHRSDA